MIFVVIIVIALISFGLWWLLIETEGVYLGRGIVIWLYDVYASRYDRIKEYEPEYEFALITVPIMSAIKPHTAPLVLDVATGTGRLPIALLSHAHFDGFVIGIDLSRKMLHHAAAKLADYTENVDFALAPAEGLPFEDNSFDVVTCLESLEFMSNPTSVICELVRVLRPGGLLLLTNRINTRWLPGHTFSEQQLHQILSDASMVNVEFEPWQVDYQRVWASKSGNSAPIGRRYLNELIHCPVCTGDFDIDGQCIACGLGLIVDDAGIVDLTRLNYQRYSH